VFGMEETGSLLMRTPLKKGLKMERVYHKLKQKGSLRAQRNEPPFS